MHTSSITRFPFGLPGPWRREFLALFAATPLALFVRAIRKGAAPTQPHARLRHGAAPRT